MLLFPLYLSTCLVIEKGSVEYTKETGLPGFLLGAPVLGRLLTLDFTFLPLPGCWCNKSGRLTLALSDLAKLPLNLQIDQGQAQRYRGVPCPTISPMDIRTLRWSELCVSDWHEGEEHLEASLFWIPVLTTQGPWRWRRRNWSQILDESQDMKALYKEP